MNNPKVLITGIAGSGGSYLAQYLVQHQPQVEVHGISRWHSTTSNNNLKGFQSKLVMHDCDLNDLSATIRALKAAKPDYIFHLAAHANVHVCFTNPIAVLQNNINSSINLFEAIRLLDLNTIVQFCSTSEVYGNVSQEESPITENHSLNPVNIYAVSKLTQEKIAASYWYAYKIPVIITRMFAYINPRRHDIFASVFARKLVEIEKGKRDILTHGNLNSVRTLIDVRDMAESYWTASQTCEYGVPYNIGGQTPISVEEFLQQLINHSSVKRKIVTQLDSDLLRPVDVTFQVPDVTKFIKKTNWKPKYSLDESINFLLQYYREYVT